ncbi:hypothetical protein C900_04954 [Fulvivirga imtechensis AK7]|uniref:SusD/RagB family nutrient-binding outer membrane lipoprotein n=2 Tax=Fulvivirga TaxID=396811 RepID=L8JPW6_9BACT|nr:hypothetical protein C900_04954 [Fulvivirga imtechensis AK7]
MLNGLQITFRDVVYNLQTRGQELTRMQNMFGSTYGNAYFPTTFNGPWTNAYANLLVDAKVLIPLAEERELYHHAGIAQVLQAYTLVILVDNFGDVPYSEALDATNFNPKVDDDEEIYAEALAMLDRGIANLKKTPLAVPKTDLYFGGDEDNWISLAKTLKLKMYLQTRLVDDVASEIQALINDGDLIFDASQAFLFQYSTTDQNPDSRHPDFSGNYVGGASDYMSNYFMGVLYTEKAVEDPRMRYYFYRQSTTTPTSPQILPCINRSAPPHYPFGTTFCAVGNGYWGRDHLDDDGIPPDTELRTIFGVYPAGGQYDADQGTLGQASSGLAGAGILPIYMHFFTDFMLAEAALTIPGVGGNHRDLLENGIRASIDYVMDFGASIATTNIPSQATIDSYVAEVLSDYDAADNNGKLAIIIKEFYISAWGNGYEAYNSYRRTGYPTDLQPTLLPSPGDFYRSLIYPQAFVDRNNQVSQKPNHKVQVFWDPGTISLD